MSYQVKLRHYFSYLVDPTARLLSKLGFTADFITIFGLLANIAVGVVIGYSKLTTGGLLVLAAGSFDMLDGALARQTDTKRPSGALLDSVIDRYSEAAVFLGLTAHFYAIQSLIGVCMSVAALAGSFFVSYVRARAEGLDLDCKVGLMQRPERIVFLSVGLVLQGILSKYGVISGETLLVAFVSVLAVLAHLTAIHRLSYSYRGLNR